MLFLFDQVCIKLLQLKSSVSLEFSSTWAKIPQHPQAKFFFGLFHSTCDVCWPQFGERQHDGCWCSLSRSNTLLPGKVVLSRVADKLDAFRNGDFNMNLWGARSGEREGTNHRKLIFSDRPQWHHFCRHAPPSYSVFSSKLRKRGRIF